MNSRTTAKRINRNEQLVKRANSVNKLIKFISFVVTVIALVLLWQFVITLFGGHRSSDALLSAIKGLAQLFSSPMRGLVQSFPGVGQGILETTYLLALGIYALGYVLIRQFLKFLVRIPGT